MLESTILESWTLFGALDGVELRKYEALRYSNGREAIARFQLDDVPRFADSCVQEFWELYDGVNPSFKFENQVVERAERLQFTKRPLYVAVLGGSVKTVGGLWVDPEGRTANMHVVVSRDMRGKGIGTKLLSYFEKDTLGVYDVLSCSWESSRQTGAESMFRRAGYGVMTYPYAGNARKSLSGR